MTLKKLRAKVVAEMTENKEAMDHRSSYGGPDPDPHGSAMLVAKSQTLRQVLAWIDEAK